MLLHRIIFIFIFLFSFAFNCHADPAESLAQEVYYETLSPFCPGRALADCPTEQAREVKQQILEDLRAGKSKQQVIEEFLDKYGRNFSSLPDMSGLNMVAWLLPIAVLLIGFVIVLRRLNKNDLQDNEQDL